MKTRALREEGQGGGEMDGWMAVEMGGRQAYARLLGSIGAPLLEDPPG